MLVGGFLGFSIAFMANLALNNGPMRALLDGSIGCLVGGIIVRVIVHSLNVSIAESAMREEQSRQGEGKESV